MNHQIGLNPDQILNEIEHSLRNYALSDIKESRKLNIMIASFILCSCFIDQMAAFRFGKSGKDRYVAFVTEYLASYSGKGLKEDLRNRLVHSYSIGMQYALIENLPEVHLKPKNGITYLDIDSFISDIEGAFNTYIKQLKTDKLCRENALNWFNSNNNQIITRQRII
jgi:hypothetical protein